MFDWLRPGRDHADVSARIGVHGPGSAWRLRDTTDDIHLVRRGDGQFFVAASFPLTGR